MSKLPLLLSVPHAGLEVPPEVADLCVLTSEQIAADGDGGAAEIYRPLADDVEVLVTTDIARAIVDQNRTEDDRRADGVVKTHTCWQEPVYREPLSDELAETLLKRYHRPYHAALVEEAGRVPFAIDCHTMAAKGPPIGPHPGVERPLLCLGNGRGSCPDDRFELLARCLEEALSIPIALNEPFAGGHITRSRPGSIHWVQIELSRAPWTSFAEKTRAIRAALVDFCARVDWKA